MKINCYSCYSSDNITYFQFTFMCKKCKIILKKCDICNMYCNNKCLEIFDKALTL